MYIAITFNFCTGVKEFDEKLIPKCFMKFLINVLANASTVPAVWALLIIVIVSASTRFITLARLSMIIYI